MWRAVCAPFGFRPQNIMLADAVLVVGVESLRRCTGCGDRMDVVSINILEIIVAIPLARMHLRHLVFAVKK